MSVYSAEWSLTIGGVVFVLAALIVVIFGRQLTRLSDELADRTGLGEALIGALFLGAATSLPEISTTITAAIEEHPDLAISTALGGIAAQTIFLVLSDFTYTRANLEHAAASIANIMQGMLAVVLLTIPILGSVTPQFAFVGMHPASFFMIGLYAYGLHLVYRTQTEAMWKPRQTAETRTDEPEQQTSYRITLPMLYVRLTGIAIAVAIGGWFLAQSGIVISEKSGLSETLVGVLFTAVATSFPELVTVLAAIRQGALTLAIGGILGGNAFDTLLIAFADFSYRGDSIYQTISDRHTFLLALNILMTIILIMGMVRREKRGFANIGFEGIALLVLYFGAVGFLFIWGEG
jgi:cation:H+ antiporter